MVGLGLLGFGLTRDPFVLPSPLVGGPAPEFNLEVMEPGEVGARARWRPPREPPDTVRLADLQGRVAVLNFWASWCLACREEHAALSSTAAAYRDRGGRVAAKHIGPISTEALRGRIDSLLAVGNGPARPGVAEPTGGRVGADGRTNG